LLLDDPAAELDQQRLGALVELVTELNCQLLITSLSPDQRIFGQPERVFHVEQGAVQGVY
jgi:recombinational DNA repair ATPase RecF